MRVLIIEDEARIAKRLDRMIRKFFEQNITRVDICDSLPRGLNFISNNTIDVLFLDLNLNGENGFDILESVVSGAFHTIIVSAYTDKAIQAFAYGVMDFVPKPFDEARLSIALNRISSRDKVVNNNLQHLAVKKSGNIRLIDLQDLRYIKGAGIYSELNLLNGTQELHDKSLESLEQLLPTSFIRIHKSYLVAISHAERIEVQSGSKYSLLLKNGEILPIGRSRYKEIKMKFL